MEPLEEYELYRTEHRIYKMVGDILVVRSIDSENRIKKKRLDAYNRFLDDLIELSIHIKKTAEERFLETKSKILTEMN